MEAALLGPLTVLPGTPPSAGGRALHASPTLAREQSPALGAEARQGQPSARCLHPISHLKSKTHICFQLFGLRYPKALPSDPQPEP